MWSAAHDIECVYSLTETENSTATSKPHEGLLANGYKLLVFNVA